jgi:aminopeptidase N
MKLLPVSFIFCLVLLCSISIANSSVSIFFLNDIHKVTFYTATTKQICSHFPHYSLTGNQHEITAITPRPYDVILYDLFLDWYNVLKNPTGMDSLDRIWYGNNNITIKIKQNNLTQIEFDASNLVIDSVKVIYNNQFYTITPTPKISGNLLKVSLPFQTFEGDTLVVSIKYTYARNIKFENYRGFYLYPKRMYVGSLPAPFYDSVFVEEKLAYTMSEPEDARYWMPCNDAPYDKAEEKITVRVPIGYTVASNGLLEKLETDGDTAKIFHWVGDKPITTYLMSVTASKYIKYSDWYRKTTNPKDSVEVQYYVWEKDYLSTKTDGSEYNARNTFSTTTAMMGFFSKTFIEYPFVKYGMVSIMPFNFGGMEHQTITSVNRVWLRVNSQFGIAHELAHQWLGDLVTCATWNDIWFNEGGATWSEALWAEKIWGKNGYNSLLQNSRSKYLRDGGLNLPAIYGLPTNTIFGTYAVLVYQKASWVYNMLKNMLGDTTFFAILRDFLRDYAYQSIETQDLINYLTNKFPNPPIDFETFFEQWIFKAGHPVYSASFSINSFQNDSGYYNANVILSQVQSKTGVSDVFQTPIRLAFIKNDSVFYKTFINNQRTQTYSFALPFFPDSVFIDTTFVLCEVTETYLTAESNQGGCPEGISPNTISPNDIQQLTLCVPTTSHYTIRIYDLLGRLIETIYDGDLDEGSRLIPFSVNKLSRGLYFINCYSNISNKTFPFLRE